jgi:hypothetical protein
VSQFLFHGALGATGTAGGCKESDKATLPPSLAQLESSEIEIDYLSSLLYSGALGTLPRNNDYFFRDVVKQAIALHNDAYSLNDKYRREALPTKGDATTRLETKRLKRLWNSFILTSSALYQHNATFLNQPILLPSASFLKRFMFLIFAWIRALPVQKTRLNRFAMSMRELSEDLIEKARDSEKCSSTAGGSNNDDTFAHAFQAEVGWKGTYLREAAAYMLLMVEISLKYKLETLRGETITKYPKLAVAAKEVRELN